MYEQLLGLAGGVGSGGTSQSPGSGGGYGNSSASATSGADSDVATGDVHGGGTSLGPRVDFSPVQLIDRVHMSGDNQVNAPISAISGNNTMWIILIGGTIALIALIALRK